MIRILLLLIAASLTCAMNVPKRILLVGNSITHAGSTKGGLDGHILCIDSSADNPEYFQIDLSTLGGAMLKKHVENGSVFSKIENGNYDLVILQGYSTSGTDPDSLYKYARILDSAITLSGAQTAFYPCYERKSRPGTADLIMENYQKIGDELGAPLIPTPYLMALAKENPFGVKLYSDDVHFTKEGQYVLSLLFYTWLSSSSPVGLSHEFTYLKYKNSPEDFFMPADQALYFQELAWEVFNGKSSDTGSVELDSLSAEDSTIIHSILEMNGISDRAVSDVLVEAVDGRAAILNFRAVGISSLPPSVSELTGLTSLTLSENSLSSLPPELGRLGKLSELRLGHNSLTELPSAIGALSKLTVLELVHNQLETLPATLGELSTLTYLYLENNHLTSLPDEIVALDVSGTLTVQGNHLQESTLSDTVINWLNTFDPGWQQFQSGSSDIKTETSAQRSLNLFIAEGGRIRVANGVDGDMSVALYSLNGRELFRSTTRIAGGVATFEIHEFHSVPQGIYLVTIQNGGTVHSVKCRLGR